MRRLVHTAAAAAALFAAVTITLPNTPATAHPVSSCSSRLGGSVECDISYDHPHVDLSSVSDGGDAAPCGVETGCTSTLCEVIIDNDSIYANGLAWDNDETVKPIPAESIIVTDELHELAMVMAAEAMPVYGGGFALSDVRGLNMPAYGSMPTGVFAETGQWQRCERRQLQPLSAEDDPDQVGVGSTMPAFEDWDLEAVTYGPVGSATLIDPLELYEQARSQIDPPEPPVMTAPPKDGLLFVKMPTWYWLEPEYWDAYAATAASPSGRLTVTVTAEPVMATWDPGDGKARKVVCYDAGREFVIGINPWTATECKHIYQHSSTMAPDGSDTWILDVEVLFAFSWEMQFDNGTLYDRGATEGATRTSSTPLQVGEIQAIIID